MKEESATLRPLPLKIAGILGMFVMAFYIAVVVGEEGGFASGLFWVVLIGTAAVLAWFADQLGRRAAQTAAVIFFILGIMSPLFLAIAFLLAVVLCVVGFVKYESGEEQEPA